MTTKTIPFVFEFPTSLTSTNGVGFISFSAAAASTGATGTTNPWISELDYINQGTTGELVIPIPAGCLRCTVTFALEVGEISGGAVLTATDEFWKSVQTEPNERGILAYPIPKTEKTYNPGPQIITVPTTVTVAIEPTSVTAWRATRMLVVWVVDEDVYLRSIVADPLSNDNTKTSNRVSVAAFASTDRKFWKLKRTADTKLQYFKQEGFAHSSSITRTYDDGEVGVEYRYTFPDHAFYPESVTSHEPGATRFVAPIVDTSTSDDFLPPAAQTSYITILNPNHLSVLSQYRALRGQIETYRTRRLVAIELIAGLSTLGETFKTYLPPGTTYVECEYLSEKSPLFVIMIQCVANARFASTGPMPTTPGNTFRPAGFVLQTLMAGQPITFGKHVKTGFYGYPAFTSLHQVPQPGGVGFKTLHTPLGMSETAPFVIDLDAPWSSTPDVLESIESTYTQWKVFIPPNTRKLNITAKLPFWTRYAWAFRLGDPPVRTEAIEPDEYLQLKSTKTNAVDLYNKLIAGEDVYGVAPGTAKLPPVAVGEPEPTEYPFSLLSWNIWPTSANNPDPATQDLPPLDEGTWLFFRLLNVADADVPTDALVPAGDPTKSDFKDEDYYGYQTELYGLNARYEVDPSTYYDDYANLAFGINGDPYGIQDEIPYILDTYHTDFTTEVGVYMYTTVTTPTGADLSQIRFRVKMLVDETRFNKWIDAAGNFNIVGNPHETTLSRIPDIDGRNAFEAWADERDLFNEE